MKNNYFKEILAIRGMGQVISVTMALLAMTLVFGIINPSFFSGENTTNLLRQVVPIMIIGIGQSFVMITGGIDLSIGSVAGMSSMISATLMTKGGMDPWVASAITIVACCLVGLINGMLVSMTKLPAFIAIFSAPMVCSLRPGESRETEEAAASRIFSMLARSRRSPAACSSAISL